jgi:hypothetical protein
MDHSNFGLVWFSDPYCICLATILSDLDKASPTKAEKEIKTEGYSIVLAISSKEEQILHCLKLQITLLKLHIFQ